VAEHDAHCLEVNASADRERCAYFERWPNACRACAGWGGEDILVDEPGDRGYPDPECDECLGKLRCGRCGGELGAADPSGASDDAGRWDGKACPACGWHSDDGTTAFADCICSARWDNEDPPF
jgi:hypothetical protein